MESAKNTPSGQALLEMKECNQGETASCDNNRLLKAFKPVGGSIVKETIS